MTWNLVKTFNVSKTWQYTEPVTGEYFKLTHTNFIQDSLYLISQVNFNSDGTVEYFDTSIIQVSESNRVIKLIPPSIFKFRRIGLRRLQQPLSFEEELRQVISNEFLKSITKLRYPSQKSSWQIKLEVSDTITTPAPTPTPTPTENNPLTIFGTNLIAWYRADSVEVVDDRITKLIDKSGKNNHAIQTVVANQPYLLVNGFNGKNVVKFDNQDVWLSMPNCLDTRWGEASLFITYDLKDNAQHWDAMHTGSNVSDYWGTSGVFGYVGYLGEFRNSRLEGQPTNMTLPGKHFLEITSGTALGSYKVVRNGELIYTGNPSWGVTATPTIGKGASNNRMNGNILDIFIVNKEATIQQKEQARNYIKTYSGLTF